MPPLPSQKQTELNCDLYKKAELVLGGENTDNLFDKYAAASTRSTGRDAGFAEFPEQIGNPDTVNMFRSYGHYVIAPRTIGVKFSYLFDL